MMIERGRREWWLFGVVGSLLALLFPAEIMAGYQYQEEREGYSLHFSLDGERLMQERSRLSIRITDPAGEAVTGLKPRVRYGMPPIKGMMPMNHKARVLQDGDHYVAEITPSMPGRWVVDLSVRIGKKRIKLKLPPFVVGGRMGM